MNGEFFVVVKRLATHAVSRTQSRNQNARCQGRDVVESLHRNVQRFRGGLVFKAHRRFESLNR